MRVLLLWCVLGGLCVARLMAEDVAAPKPVLPFVAGEMLSFAVKWNGVPIGSTEVIFHGEEDRVTPYGKTVYKITSRGETIKYKGLDVIYADPQTWLPLRVERDLTYLGSHEQATEVYDPKACQVVIDKTVNGKQEAPQVISKTAPLANSILLYYGVRLQDLGEGKTFSVNLPTQAYVFTVTKSRPIKGRPVWKVSSYPKGVSLWVDMEKPYLPLKIMFTKPFSIVTMDLQKSAHLS